MRDVLTDSPSLTEKEFFQRELNLKFLSISPNHLVPRLKHLELPVLIASTNPFIWLESLKKLPTNSTIFFLLGNETYEPRIFNALNGLSSIVHVYVYNPPSSVSWKHSLGAVLGDLYDQLSLSCSYEELSAVFRDFKTSFHLGQKFKSTNLNYSWSALPQGYSNSFAIGLEALGLAPKSLQSLANENYVCSLAKTFTKSKYFTFVGQATNRRREQVLSIVRKKSNSLIQTKLDGFGGNVFDGDTGYVGSLLRSWFNVIPPGFFNNYNHRYTESCITSSLPLILAHNSIDHSQNSNWTNSLSILQGHSFHKLISFVESLDESSLMSLVVRIRNEDFHKIDSTKISIRSLLSTL